MEIFRNLKLQYKVILMAVLPVLIMCIVAIIISNTVVKDKLLDDSKQKLRATAKAVLAAYDQNTGDYFVNSSGDVWKGSYNVSLSDGFIDDIEAKTDVAVTFFYGDKRLVTSLKDKEGNPILGSKAGEFLVKNVLQEGNEVFTNRVLVEDEFYFGYYIPVYQNNSDEIIGMIFAGMPVKLITASLNLITTIFTVAIVIILISTVVICSLVAKSLAGSIQNSMQVVEKIAEGNLNVEISDKALQRKDEVGQLSVSTKRLIDNLSLMIGSISNNTKSLNSSSQEMNAVAGQASDAMESINQNLKNVLSQAVAQTGSARNIQNNIDNINVQIGKTMNEVDELSGSAQMMLEAGGSVEQTLSLLEISNKEVIDEIENIRTQTMQTNEAVEKIIQAVTLITDIAEQTNLLSLNAAIEAARAGEAGRGFNVVAEEINKLASQSNDASMEITEIVQVLSENSHRTVSIMGEVQGVLNEQTKNVSDTANVFGQVQSHITRVVHGVDIIRDSTTMLEKETEEITVDIQNLNDIALNNEDTVKGTINYSDEVLGTVNSVNDMSVEVSTSANDMAGAVSRFQI